LIEAIKSSLHVFYCRWPKDPSPHDLEPGPVSIGPKGKTMQEMIFKANTILFCLIYFLSSAACTSLKAHAMACLVRKSLCSQQHLTQ
jgi:hypothetical protein